MSGFLTGLECGRCATFYPGDTPRALCDCGGPLLARYDLAAIRAAVTPADIARPRPRCGAIESCYRSARTRPS